jgi:hypothetical protein
LGTGFIRLSLLYTIVVRCLWGSSHGYILEFLFPKSIWILIAAPFSIWHDIEITLGVAEEAMCAPSLKKIYCIESMLLSKWTSVL